jgi:ferredoxin-NAD(P)+ reductase (naphthalene dioxygenase ferredoxin-specific)
MQMNYKVTFRDAGIVIKVPMGKTILESALGQGINLPHGCKSGNCGACKSILHTGDIEMSPYSKYALTGEEKNRNLFLPCRSVPWSDCEISLIDDDEAVVHASRLLECEVTDLIQATHDIRIIKMKILAGGPYNFSAGQYASITFSGLPPRDYSMANMPSSKTLEFHIRLVPDGAVTPYVQNELNIGDIIRVQGPYGTAYLRESHKGPIIAAAGGSGLAPIKSILEVALSSKTKQPITFYFGARDERDLYLENAINSLTKSHKNFSFIPVLSEAKGSSTRRVGLLADAIAKDFQNLDGCKAYLAGPPIMVESTVKKLEGLGIQRVDCHADAFYTEADKKGLEEK